MKTKFEKFNENTVSIDNLFIVSHGLGGGFGGAQDYIVIEADDEEDAEKQAYEMACEDYEGYVGMYGLRDIDEIMEEDEVDEMEAEDIYNDDRESWLDYSVEKWSKEAEKNAEGHHYQNDYKNITG